MFLLCDACIQRIVASVTTKRDFLELLSAVMLNHYVFFQLVDHYDIRISDAPTSLFKVQMYHNLQQVWKNKS